MALSPSLSLSLALTTNPNPNPTPHQVSESDLFDEDDMEGSEAGDMGGSEMGESEMGAGGSDGGDGSDLQSDMQSEAGEDDMASEVRYLVITP